MLLLFIDLISQSCVSSSLYRMSGTELKNNLSLSSMDFVLLKVSIHLRWTATRRDAFTICNVFWYDVGVSVKYLRCLATPSGMKREWYVYISNTHYNVGETENEPNDTIFYRFNFTISRFINREQ
jgi:hypothetical protein